MQVAFINKGMNFFWYVFLKLKIFQSPRPNRIIKTKTRHIKIKTKITNATRVDNKNLIFKIFPVNE